MAASESGQGGGNEKITIHIDKDVFHVQQTSMTGADLRQLPSPPIGPDRDLFEVTPGPADDIRISDDQSVELHNGEHFFTAPSTINPGVNA